MLFGQIKGDTVEESWEINKPLKVLRNLLLTTDLEESNRIGRDLGLPHALFDPLHDTVEKVVPHSFYNMLSLQLGII